MIVKPPLPFFILLVLSLFKPAEAVGQASPVVDRNFNSWYVYWGNHQFSNHWGLHTESQWRRSNAIKSPQQLLLRTAINYYINQQATVSLGYAFVETYPYGGYPVAATFPENRIYQQLSLRHQQAAVKLLHRYRLEQRWMSFPNAASPVYFNRVRYLLRGERPLKGKVVKPGSWYLAATNEVYVNFGKNVGQNIFDQNRASVALGYKLNKYGQFEAGYLHQLISKSNAQIFESNNTFQLALVYNLDFRREE